MDSKLQIIQRHWRIRNNAHASLWTFIIVCSTFLFHFTGSLICATLIALTQQIRHGAPPHLCNEIECLLLTRVRSVTLWAADRVGCRASSNHRACTVYMCLNWLDGGCLLHSSPVTVMQHVGGRRSVSAHTFTNSSLNPRMQFSSSLQHCCSTVMHHFFLTLMHFSWE